MAARPWLPIESAGEHYVLYWLHQMGLLAAALPPRTAVADVVVFDGRGGVGAMVQVKTARSGPHGWVMNEKNERAPYDAPGLFYALVDLEPVLRSPDPNRPAAPLVYIVPAPTVAAALRADHHAFVQRGGRENPTRRLRSRFSPPLDEFPHGWLDDFLGRWDLLRDAAVGSPGAGAPAGDQ